MKLLQQVNYIVIHCTDTPAGRSVTVADVDSWHRGRGFECIGYHYLVYLDGSVHLGRSVRYQGAHCTRVNSCSIAVCYVGGRNSMRKDDYADTRTPEQRAALRALVAELLRQHPGALVRGHRDFDAKACPCFDVATQL